jgi:acyl-CoA reductase-like NAD-dependent aldehyde dehydrogenase
MGRLEVLKTYKLYIGGQFPRTESGRYYTPTNKDGQALANVCLSSRKDVRNCVQAARKAFGGWSERAAFNRGQILYRIAEMLEGRKIQFMEELLKQGLTPSEAETEVTMSIDRIVYYAGWCDKYQALLSTVNPVATSHFNFSVAEPMGVVGVIAPSNYSLLGFVSLVMPVICGGNTCVFIASESMPLCAVTFAEVIHASDVPGGVVNVLTGATKEIAEPMSTHMDVNAIIYGGDDDTVWAQIQTAAHLNVKRVYRYTNNWINPEAQNLQLISDTQEIKTTWHPVENIGGATSSY